MNETIVVRGDGVTLDLLLWRRFGRVSSGLVAEALAINPGLAALGINIPPGTTVVLPPASSVAATPASPAVSLFD